MNTCTNCRYGSYPRDAFVCINCGSENNYENWKEIEGVKEQAKGEKGRQLTFKEVKNLKQDDKNYYVESKNKFVPSGTYKLIDDHHFKYIENHAYGFSSGCSAIEDGTIKVYEWIEEPKHYYGDEILKMIRAGELKEGDKFKRVSTKYPADIFAVGSDREPSMDSLKEDTFILVPKEYLTFDVARKTGKSLRYKTWSEFHPLPKAIDYINAEEFATEELNQILDEKAWEVKNE